MGHTYSVWVYFQRELPVGRADVLVGCIGNETEQFVGVYFRIFGHAEMMTVVRSVQVGPITPPYNIICMAGSSTFNGGNLPLTLSFPIWVL